jgi:hypothetical protein
MTMTDDAEHTLNNLQQKREALVARGHRLGEERGKISFAAHAGGDAKARKQLDELNRELALHDAELRSLDCAIVEADTRVKTAQAAEVAAVNRQKAAEARKLVSELGEVFPYLDRKLEEAGNALIAINDGIQQLHGLGFASPTDNQARLNICAIIETWAMRLPKHFHNQLRDGVRFLAPHERKTGVQYWTAIELSLQNQIAQRLGKTEPARVKEEAA